MDTDLQFQLQLASIKTLSLEVSQRLGSNPYDSIDFESLSKEDLERVRKALHEILYAPPSRQS